MRASHHIILRLANDSLTAWSPILRLAAMESWLRARLPETRVTVIAPQNTVHTDFLYSQVRELTLAGEGLDPEHELAALRLKKPADLVWFEGDLGSRNMARRWLTGASAVAWGAGLSQNGSGDLAGSYLLRLGQEVGNLLPGASHTILNPLAPRMNERALCGGGNLLLTLDSFTFEQQLALATRASSERTPWSRRCWVLAPHHSDGQAARLEQAWPGLQVLRPKKALQLPTSVDLHVTDSVRSSAESAARGTPFVLIPTSDSSDNPDHLRAFCRRFGGWFAGSSDWPALSAILRVRARSARRLVERTEAMTAPLDLNGWGRLLAQVLTEHSAMLTSDCKLPLMRKASEVRQETLASYSLKTAIKEQAGQPESVEHVERSGRARP